MKRSVEGALYYLRDRASMGKGFHVPASYRTNEEKEALRRLGLDPTKDYSAEQLRRATR